MDHKTAVLVFMTVVGACVSASAGVAIRAAISAKRHSTKISIVQTLLACALSTLLIALAHVLVGGQLPEFERRGLWNDGTLIVFPTSMAGLGASLTSLWAVLWTAEAATRQRYAQTVAERQRDATQLLRAFNQLTELTSDIYTDWFVNPSAPRALGLYIREAWDRIFREVAGGANADDDSAHPAAEGCVGPCTIHLPHTNAYFSETEFGATEGSGCSHFLRALEGELPALYRLARRLAATKRNRMVWVYDTIRDLEALLRKLQLDAKPLLADALLFQSVYPRELPDARTSEGLWVLAGGLHWSHLVTADTSWERQYRLRAQREGVRIIDGDSGWRLRDLRLARDAPATRSNFERAVRQSLATASGRMITDVEFWSEVSTAANLSPTNQSTDD